MVNLNINAQKLSDSTTSNTKKAEEKILPPLKNSKGVEKKSVPNKNSAYSKKLDDRVFDKIKIFLQDGKKFKQRPVIVTFSENSMTIEGKKDKFLKKFAYKNIRSAEYSYSKSPRWKTGTAMGVASVLFPPLLFVALPLGFSKHRRHWITIRTDSDYAVLKIRKGNRKIFIPTFETKTKVEIEPIGEEK